jgi:hypothetical protein
MRYVPTRRAITVVLAAVSMGTSLSLAMGQPQQPQAAPPIDLKSVHDGSSPRPDRTPIVRPAISQDSLQTPVQPFPSSQNSPPGAPK